MLTHHSEIFTILQDMNSAELVQEFKEANDIIPEDLLSISQNMESFQSDFNATIKFFGNLENTLDMFYSLYEEYQTPLYLCLYVIMVVIGSVLFLQVISLVLKTPGCIKNIGT